MDPQNPNNNNNNPQQPAGPIGNAQNMPPEQENPLYSSPEPASPELPRGEPASPSQSPDQGEPAGGFAPQQPPQGVPGIEHSLEEPSTTPPDIVVPPISRGALPFDEEGGGKKGLPLKPILFGLLGIVFLATVGFTAKTFLFKEKISITKEPATITYWGLWEDTSVMSGLISEYEGKNKDVKIKYVKQSKEDYRERLVNTLAKGGPGTPDIFRFHNTWVPMLSSGLGSLPPQVMDATTFQKTFYPTASQDLRRGVDIVGIPLMFDGLGLYINTDIFTKAGKSPPATWDDLRKSAIELTVKDDGGNIEQAGVALGRTDNVDNWEDVLALMMIQNGADLANPTGKLAEDSLAFFTVFSAKDKVWDETLPPSTQAFAAGKLAMYFGPSWRAFAIKTLNPNLAFRVVPVPQLPKSNPQDPDITWASYWAEGVWSKSKYQKESWEFLKFLASKESLQKLYQAAVSSRLFGQPYPLPEMASLLEEDPVVGAYIKQAPQARSWYLASRTFDGQTGINSRISAYFADAVNGIVSANKSPEEALVTVESGVKQVLSSYTTAK